MAPGFWNAGLASEAVRALIAANPHADAQIFAEVFQDNVGSARVLTNAGFTWLGDAEAFFGGAWRHRADLDLCAEAMTTPPSGPRGCGCGG